MAKKGKYCVFLDRDESRWLEGFLMKHGGYSPQKRSIEDKIEKYGR